MNNLIIIDNQEFNLDRENETFFATQQQIAEIFEVERTVITKHLKNIFESEELDKKSNVQKMHNSTKPTYLYSLDVIIAVGYRVNSAKATQFRKKATAVLKEYLTTGEVKKANIEINSAFLLQLSEEMRKKELLIEEQKNKIEIQDETINLISNTQDSYNMQEASKKLIVRQKDLKNFLKDRHWIMYKRDEKENLIIYPKAASQKLGFTKMSTVLNTRQNQYYPQFRITNKGMDYLIKRRHEIIAFN